jgi:excisionase family DNA binding protein
VPTTATAPNHLNAAALAKRLDVHKNTALKLLDQGEFPNAYRITRDWRIPESDITAYIERRRQAARTERANKRPAGSHPPAAA